VNELLNPASSEIAPAWDAHPTAVTVLRATGRARTGTPVEIDAVAILG
jgi:hypothetical protein